MREIIIIVAMIAVVTALIILLFGEWAVRQCEPGEYATVRLFTYECHKPMSATPPAAEGE